MTGTAPDDPVSAGRDLIARQPEPAPTGNLPATTQGAPEIKPQPQGPGASELVIAPGVAPEGYNPIAVEQHRTATHNYLKREFPAGADWLQERWGGGRNYGENLMFAAHFIGLHPDLQDGLGAFGLNDHPAIIWAAAVLGRKYARVAGDHKTIQRSTPRTSGAAMSDQQREQMDSDIEGIRGQIVEAQARGNTTKANTLHQRELEMIRARDGAKPIVNGRRTS